MRLSWLPIALLVAPPLTAAPASACSVGLFGPMLRDTEVFFTGTATPDTLLAGPGTMRYRSVVDPSGPAPERPFHGQVLRVDRIGGPAAGRLPAKVTEVVVVPWGVDPACGPIRWRRSARWVDPGKHGFYIATLRPPEHWTDGRPTVDLQSFGWFPYTGTEPIPEMDPDTPVSSLLSPARLFDVYRALPSYAETRARGAAVLEPLRAWARDHPDLATAMPAKRLLGNVTVAIAGEMIREELRGTDHPVLGTWRFTLHMPGGGTRVFFGRTGAHPTERLSRSPPPTEDPLELRIPPAEGYSFSLATARTLEELPATPREAYRRGSGSIRASARADSADDGTAGWRGSLGPDLLREVLSHFGFLLRDATDETYRRSAQRVREGLPAEIPSWFTEGTDGMLRVAHSFPLSGGGALLLEGEQVSREVIGIR